MRASRRSNATWRRRRWRSTASRRDRSSRRVSRAVRSAPAVAYWRVTIGHLLQDSVDALPGARAHLDVVNLATPDEATAQGLVDRLRLDLGCKRTLDNDVDQRSQRSGDANTVDGFEVARGQPRSMKSEPFRGRRHALKTRRDR